MEIIKIKNSRNLNLAADYYKASSDYIIIMCHGFGYDRHEKENKFDKLADHFFAAGYSVLKFDFSGMGESDDDAITVGKHVDDLSSVLKYTKEQGYTKIILFGNSLGSLYTWHMQDESIKAIIGVGPVTAGKDVSWPQDKFNKEELKGLETTGQLIFQKPSGPRDFVILDKQYIQDRLAINQKELLSNITCPVLIIHADGDTFVPLEVSRKAVEILGDKAELHVLVGGTHAFLENIDTVANKTIDWLKDKI